MIWKLTECFYDTSRVIKVHPYFDRLIKPLLERQPINDDGQYDMSGELDQEIKEMKEVITEQSSD